MDLALLIFTDLDGTLLDQQTYAHQGADETLQRLHRLAIPVVLTSSKTCAEISALQRELGLHEAFIAENGGGIFVPQGHPLERSGALQPTGERHLIQLGKPYADIRKIFAMLRGSYELKGFGDMSIEEIMGLTSLTREQARLATRRDFSEPFLLQGEERLEALKAEAARFDLSITRGGRFYCLMSAHQNKGLAVTTATRLYQEIHRERIVTIGLGDDENDRPMLEVVDIPVVVPKPDGNYAALDVAGIRKAPWPGSRGWGAAVTAILDEYPLPGARR
jgi:mannosyl-3-phosphoglycerate phosphatase